MGQFLGQHLNETKKHIIQFTKESFEGLRKQKNIQLQQKLSYFLLAIMNNDKSILNKQIENYSGSSVACYLQQILKNKNCNIKKQSFEHSVKQDQVQVQQKMRKQSMQNKQIKKVQNNNNNKSMSLISGVLNRFTNKNNKDPKEIILPKNQPKVNWDPKKKKYIFQGEEQEIEKQIPKPLKMKQIKNMVNKSAIIINTNKSQFDEMIAPPTFKRKTMNKGKKQILKTKKECSSSQNDSQQKLIVLINEQFDTLSHYCRQIQNHLLMKNNGDEFKKEFQDQINNFTSMYTTINQMEISMINCLEMTNYSNSYNCLTLLHESVQKIIKYNPQISQLNPKKSQDKLIEIVELKKQLQIINQAKNNLQFKCKQFQTLLEQDKLNIQLVNKDKVKMHEELQIIKNINYTLQQQCKFKNKQIQQLNSFNQELLSTVKKYQLINDQLYLKLTLFDQILQSKSNQDSLLAQIRHKKLQMLENNLNQNNQSTKISSPIILVDNQKILKLTALFDEQTSLFLNCSQQYADLSNKYNQTIKQTNKLKKQINQDNNSFNRSIIRLKSVIETYKHNQVQNEQKVNEFELQIMKLKQKLKRLQQEQQFNQQILEKTLSKQQMNSKQLLFYQQEGQKLRQQLRCILDQKKCNDNQIQQQSIKIQELLKNEKKLLKTIKNLEQYKIQIQKQNKKIIQLNQQYQKQNKVIQQKLYLAEQKYLNLQETYEKLLKEYINLQNNWNELQNKNQQLLNNYQILYNLNQQLKINIQQLKNQYQQLQIKYKQTQDNFNQFETKQNLLKKRIEQLENGEEQLIILSKHLQLTEQSLKQIINQQNIEIQMLKQQLIQYESDKQQRKHVQIKEKQQLNHIRQILQLQLAKLKKYQNNQIQENNSILSEQYIQLKQVSLQQQQSIQQMMKFYQLFQKDHSQEIGLFRNNIDSLCVKLDQSQQHITVLTQQLQLYENTINDIENLMISKKQQQDKAQQQIEMLKKINQLNINSINQKQKQIQQMTELIDQLSKQINLLKNKHDSNNQQIFQNDITQQVNNKLEVQQILTIRNNQLSDQLQQTLKQLKDKEQQLAHNQIKLQKLQNELQQNLTILKEQNRKLIQQIENCKLYSEIMSEQNNRLKEELLNSKSQSKQQKNIQDTVNKIIEMENVLQQTKKQNQILNNLINQKQLQKNCQILAQTEINNDLKIQEQAKDNNEVEMSDLLFAQQEQIQSISRQNQQYKNEIFKSKKIQIQLQDQLQRVTLEFLEKQKLLNNQIYQMEADYLKKISDLRDNLTEQSNLLKERQKQMQFKIQQLQKQLLTTNNIRNNLKAIKEQYGDLQKENSQLIQEKIQLMRINDNLMAINQYKKLVVEEKLDQKSKKLQQTHKNHQQNNQTQKEIANKNSGVLQFVSALFLTPTQNKICQSQI